MILKRQVKLKASGKASFSRAESSRSQLTLHSNTDVYIFMQYFFVVSKQPGLTFRQKRENQMIDIAGYDWLACFNPGISSNQKYDAPFAGREA